MVPADEQGLSVPRPSPIPRGPALWADFNRWMLDERGWARTTRVARDRTVRRADRFVRGGKRRGLLWATRQDALAFLAEAARHPKTRNLLLSDLRAFYRFGRERGWRKRDPTRDIARVPEPKNLPRPVPYDAAVRLLEAGHLVSERAFTIVALLLYTGMRREEAATLPRAALDLSERRARVMGKGSKERIIPLHPELVEILRAWLGHLNGSGYVFPSARGYRPHMHSVTLWGDVKKAAAAAGLAGEVAPHRLRHTFATELLRGGTDIRHVQELLGHASLSSTQIYTKVVVEDLEPDVARLDFAPHPPTRLL